MTLLPPIPDIEESPFWEALRQMVETLTLLLAPAGAGQTPMPLTRWRRARQRIRDAEGLLRRALFAGAEALLPHLPPVIRCAVAARPPAPQSATIKVGAPLIR
ncbi:MAG: hypothetical protein AAFR44_11075, partial [Pseudomonadota bacterium]